MPRLSSWRAARTGGTESARCDWPTQPWPVGSVTSLGSCRTNSSRVRASCHGPRSRTCALSSIMRTTALTTNEFGQHCATTYQSCSRSSVDGSTGNWAMISVHGGTGLVGETWVRVGTVESESHPLRSASSWATDHPETTRSLTSRGQLSGIARPFPGLGLGAARAVGNAQGAVVSGQVRVAFGGRRNGTTRSGALGQAALFSSVRDGDGEAGHNGRSITSEPD